jgi:hypothetical protein
MAFRARRIALEISFQSLPSRRHHLIKLIYVRNSSLVSTGCNTSIALVNAICWSLDQWPSWQQTSTIGIDILNICSTLKISGGRWPVKQLSSVSVTSHLKSAPGRTSAIRKAAVCRLVWCLCNCGGQSGNFVNTFMTLSFSPVRKTGQPLASASQRNENGESHRQNTVLNQWQVLIPRYLSNGKVVRNYGNIAHWRRMKGGWQRHCNVSGRTHSISGVRQSDGCATSRRGCDATDRNS